MIFKELPFPGVYEIILEPREDSRGFFMRTYDDTLFAEHDLHKNWVQENHTMNLEKNVVRGLHFQFPPHVEAKLVRVIVGEVYDVFLDLRTDSSTFGKWGSVMLSANAKNIIFLPRGFAHGYCTLTEGCEILYKMDSYFAPDAQGTVRWDSPELGIPWPVENPFISEKDANAKTFNEFVEEHGGLTGNE
jgi:dTDP-4-dehydrorhamnose 3,5-epimerase